MSCLLCDTKNRVRPIKIKKKQNELHGSYYQAPQLRLKYTMDNNSKIIVILFVFCTISRLIYGEIFSSIGELEKLAYREREVVEKILHASQLVNDEYASR
jgi:transcriptional regulatory protein LevR